MKINNNKHFLLTTCIISVFLTFFDVSYSQDITKSEESTQIKAVKIFIEGYGENDYLRENVRFVNYVRDPKQADIYILVRSQSTGGGGREFTILFNGQTNFQGMDDTLKYVSRQSDTEDIERKGLVKKVKLGLMRYVVNSPVANDVLINYNKPAKKIIGKPEEVEDKWNNWVFQTRFSTSINGEKSYMRNRINGSFSANRVTEDWKIQTSVNTSYTEKQYETDEGNLKFFDRSNRFSGLLVKSINSRWSAGITGEVTSLTYDNRKLSTSVSPALEFNIFPYSEAARREFRIQYSIGYRHVDYHEETIYDKMSESLVNTSFEVVLVTKGKWGNVVNVLESSAYLNDLNKNSFEWVNILDFRLTQGLSFNLLTVIEIIHDQLHLPKGGASYEDVLLERKSLETQYSYFVSVGFSYTFGSMFTNVVNPRF